MTDPGTPPSHPDPQQQAISVAVLARAYEHLKSSFYVPVETGPAAGFTAGGYMMAAYCDEAQEVTQSSAVYDWYRGRVSATGMPLWWTPLPRPKPIWLS